MQTFRTSDAVNKGIWGIPSQSARIFINAVGGSEFGCDFNSLTDFGHRDEYRPKTRFARPPRGRH